MKSYGKDDGEATNMRNVWAGLFAPRHKPSEPRLRPPIQRGRNVNIINLRMTTVITTILFLILLPSGGQAAHSHRRPVRTRVITVYDRSITTFNPQGRLLQVEYALQAATERGSTSLVAVLYNQTLYVGLTTATRASSSVDVTHTNRNLHRLDANMFLFTTGLAGDAMAFANDLRVQCLQHRLSYGEACTVRECAQAAASLQHALTQQAGVRPLGVTGIVLGWDVVDDDGAEVEEEEQTEDGSSSTTTRQLKNAHLYRTQPGSTLEDCWYTTAGRKQDILLKQWHALYPTLHRPVDVVRQLVSTLLTQNAYDDGATTNSQQQQQQEPTRQVWILQPTQSTATTTTPQVSCLPDLPMDVSEQDLMEALAQVGLEVTDNAEAKSSQENVE